MNAPFAGGPDDVAPWLRDNGMDQVRVLWPDMAGLARCKIVPAERFPDAAGSGIGFSAVALSFDGLSNPARGSGLGGERGYANIRAIPDLSTLCVAPHLDGVALCLADPVGADGGELAEGPRNLAKRVAADLAAAGYASKVAPELEAYLLDRDGSQLEAGMPCYGAETLARFADPLDRIVRTIAAFAPLEAWHHEHGPGQFEINVGPLGLVAAADALFLARTASREAAEQAGRKLTWMAKPFSGLNGSACQINLSLWSADGGSNLFHDAADGLGLSELARWFVGGLLDHLDDVAAILLPNANSYRRVTPGHFAPVSKAWGVDNRTAAVRVITDSPAATRIEVRVGGSDLASHLAMPVLVAAGLDGVRRKLDPGAPAHGDLESADGPRVIDDWRLALDHFDASAWASQALSPELHRLYGLVKRQEYERWRRHVSDFDRDEYGGQF